MSPSKREVRSTRCAACGHCWDWHTLKSTNYACIGPSTISLYEDCGCTEFELDYGDVTVQT